MSTVCKYFLRGSCNYGNQCRFIHPGQTTRVGNIGVNAGTQSKPNNYLAATIDSIRVDLIEKPMWLLSSYAPGKSPPCQLIDGKDVSFEEVRLMAYQCQAEGNPTAYEQQWIRMNAEAETQTKNIMNDLAGAINFMTQAQDIRAQVYRYKQSNGEANGPTSGFAQPQQQSQNPFGAPSSSAPQSAFNQTGFPQPTFGQPSQPTSAFSTSSPFVGTAPTSQPGFGQAAFAQSSAPQSAFGKPTQSAFNQPAFGHTSAAPQSVFGKPAFGQPAFGQSGFGQPQQSLQQPSQQPSAFITSSASQPKPAFGQPAFGQSTFGQPGLLSSGDATPFATAAHSQSTASPFSAFSQQSVPQGGVATPNPFGQPQAPSPFSQVNPFQQSQQAQSETVNSFGQTATAKPQPPIANAFAHSAQQPNAASPFSNANPFQTVQQVQPPTTPSSTNPNGQLQTPGQKEKKWDDPVIEYTAQEIEAFRAPLFTMCMIPLVAPPRELCV